MGIAFCEQCEKPLEECTCKSGRFPGVVRRERVPTGHEEDCMCSRAKEQTRRAASQLTDMPAGSTTGLFATHPPPRPPLPFEPAHECSACGGATISLDGTVCCVGCGYPPCNCSCPTSQLTDLRNPQLPQPRDREKEIRQLGEAILGHPPQPPDNPPVSPTDPLPIPEHYRGLDGKVRYHKCGCLFGLHTCKDPLSAEKREALDEACRNLKPVSLTPDPVNHPTHYTSHPSGVECIDITEHMGFCVGNAIKYIWRADLKDNNVQDLDKAIWYLKREIRRRLLGEDKKDEQD